MIDRGIRQGRLMTVYAWRTDRPPSNPAAPVTGWVHENGEPWRVITSEDRAEMDEMGRTFTVAEYDGGEETVSHAEWLASA